MFPSALSVLKIPYSVVPVVRIPITNPPHTNILPTLDVLPFRSFIFCSNIPGRMKLIIEAAVPPVSNVEWAKNIIRSTQLHIDIGFTNQERSTDPLDQKQLKCLVPKLPQ